MIVFYYSSWDFNSKWGLSESLCQLLNMHFWWDDMENISKAQCAFFMCSVSLFLKFWDFLLGSSWKEFSVRVLGIRNKFKIILFSGNWFPIRDAWYGCLGSLFLRVVGKSGICESDYLSFVISGIGHRVKRVAEMFLFFTLHSVYRFLQ